MEGKITGRLNIKNCTEGKITERLSIVKCTEGKISGRLNIEKHTERSDPKDIVTTESWTAPLSASTTEEKNKPNERDQPTSQQHVNNKCSTSDQCMYESVEKCSYDEQVRQQRGGETFIKALWTTVREKEQNTGDVVTKTLPTSTQTQMCSRLVLCVREKEQDNTCRLKNLRENYKSLPTSVKKQMPNLAGEMDQSVDSEPQHARKDKKSLCENLPTDTYVMKKLPSPVEKSTFLSIVRKCSNHEEGNNEVDNNKSPLIMSRAPSTQIKMVHGPSTKDDIPVLQNGKERVSRTYSTDNTIKLCSTSEQNISEETENMSKNHCQISLDESGWSCGTSNYVVITIDDVSPMHPVISQTLASPEVVGISTVNSAVTRDVEMKVQSVVDCGHTEADSYRGIFTVSGHCNAFPTACEPSHCGKDTQVKVSKNSDHSATNLQKDICQEKIQVTRETRLQDHLTKSETIPENNTHIEAAVANVKDTSETDTMRDGEKKSLSESAANSAVGLENNLHSHIAFLVDSREQQRTSSESISQGVVTRDVQGINYSNCDYYSSEKVRSMMKRRRDGQATCSVCGVTTTYRAFYKHAKKHFNIKPFKCGYCSYRSIEKSKIRVHNTFCHSSKPCLIQRLSPECAVLQNTQAYTHTSSSLKSELNSLTPFITDNENDEITENKNDTVCSRNSVMSVEDGHSSESYPQSKASMISETECEAKKTHNQSDNTTCSSDQPAQDCTRNKTHRSQMYKCPVCFRVMKKHTPSVRRHLYSHYGYKPHKCGHCSFMGCGPAEVSFFCLFYCRLSDMLYDTICSIYLVRDRE